MAKKSRSRAKTRTSKGVKIDNNLLLIFAGCIAILLLIMIMVKMLGVEVREQINSTAQGTSNEQLQKDVRAVNRDLNNLQKGTQDVNNSLNQKSSF